MVIQVCLIFPQQSHYNYTNNYTLFMLVTVIKQDINF